MHTVANFFGFQRDASRVLIEEDSVPNKVLSCIPIVGMVFSMIQEFSLAEQIQQTRSLNRMIGLIQLKNEYKVANVIRNFILVAFVVADLVFSRTDKFFGFAALLVLTGVIAKNIYEIQENNQAIESLQRHERGFEDLGNLTIQ